MRRGPGMCLILATLLSASIFSSAGDVLAKGGVSAGGGGAAPAISCPLPSTSSAPDVIMRESFGLADLWRPTGGKGQCKNTYLHTPIQGFWLEYPGSKDTAWLAPSEGQTWRFCAWSNPIEMPSPIQTMLGTEGCVASEWFDAPVVDIPTALMAFKAPATAYEVSINGYSAPLPGMYVGIGLTGSSLLYSNLETSASVWLLLKPNFAFDGTTVIYELRVNGMNDALLATGETISYGYNQLALSYDPIGKTVSASVNGIDLGAYSQTIPTPKYIGFEGVGILDNFVVRKLP